MKSYMTIYEKNGYIIAECNDYKKVIVESVQIKVDELIEKH